MIITFFSILELWSHSVNISPVCFQTVEKTKQELPSVQALLRVKSGDRFKETENSTICLPVYWVTRGPEAVYHQTVHL